jgi:hypothetical protein
VLNETERQELKKFADHSGRLVVLGEDSSGIPKSPQKILLSSDPVREYYNALQAGFAAGSADPPQELLNALGANDGIQLDAPPTVAANFATVNGAPNIYLVNFGGLVPGKVAVPTPANSIRIRVPAAMGNSLSYLPFLGEAQIVQGEKRGDRVEFTLPPLERGAVVSVMGER